MASTTEEIRSLIESGNTSIGIELGSTRIKAVLIDAAGTVLASGGYDWENSYINSIWTYGLDEVWQGIQGSYVKMAENIRSEYNMELTKTSSIGFSGMMHGYMAFDRNDELLVPFRTWRNNITGPASEELTGIFDFPIPQRWSIAHLYQSILNKEEHVASIRFMTTLAGYIHWKLTGKKVLGIGEASGYFPIDSTTRNFNTGMIDQFNRHIESYGFPWKLQDLMPEVMVAGQEAGRLSPEGALLIDPAGKLQSGIPLCPPEGDAGTGMVATNSIAVRTGNVSAGTSVFAMIVLEKALTKAYSELDLVTTPEGNDVAMVHSNNCTSDYDAWIGLFSEAVKALGMEIPKYKIYDTLLGLALEGDPDCGGLLSYGYISGEHITKFEEGRPLFVRSSDSKFNLANFMRVNLFTSLGALKTGMDILIKKEAVEVDEIRGHGGFFKTKEVGQRVMAAATNVPISVMETAGEGGAWGIALLASFMINKRTGESLTDYLAKRIFADMSSDLVKPDASDVSGFNKFFERYTKGLPIERSAIEYLK